MVHGGLNSRSGLGHCQSRLLSLGGNLVGEYFPEQESDEETILKVSKPSQVFFFFSSFRFDSSEIDCCLQDLSSLPIDSFQSLESNMITIETLYQHNFQVLLFQFEFEIEID